MRTFLAEGSATIGEINDHLGLNLDEDNEDYDTVGGLIIKLLGYIPEEDEEETYTLVSTMRQEKSKSLIQFCISYMRCFPRIVLRE